MRLGASNRNASQPQSSLVHYIPKQEQDINTTLNKDQEQGLNIENNHRKKRQVRACLGE